MIAPGVVDQRDIWDVTPGDVDGFTQHHFFAGIGGWSYALRLAGWPDNRPVWTGSCPCQPFSAAGQGKRFTDERHLWPVWFHLIEQCRPATIFGEQVDAAVRAGWLDLVQADMEGIGYAVWAPVVPAAGVGAPHIRHRLWFVAESMQSGRAERRPRAGVGPVTGRGDFSSVEHPGGRGREWRQASASGYDNDRQTSLWPESKYGSGVADATGFPGGGTGPLHGFWGSADWLFCKDAKWRPVEPGSFPLADGVPFRLADGRSRENSSRKEILKCIGNSIVPQVAAEFIGAYLAI